MFDTAVWGSGDTEQGRFKANKAIASANIEEVPGGIEVNWGGGDVEILTGSNPTITPIYTETGNALYRYSQERRIKYPNNTYSSWVVARYFSRLDTQPLTQHNGYLGSNPYRMIRVSVKSAKGNSVADGFWNTSGDNSESAVILHTAWVDYLTASNAHQCLFEFRNYSRQLWAGTAQQSVTGYRVQTDTNDFSERTTTTAPTVTELTAGCKVVITHEDSQIIEIPLDYCPLWVNLLDSQACPAGTCECIHDGHKCCYDSNTGELIKVISL